MIGKCLLSALVIAGLTVSVQSEDYDRALWHNGISREVGLTEGEKRTLLDEHNRLRAKQARGEVPGQPQAADITFLEWSDETAQHAQTWANNCSGPMHGYHMDFGEGQNYAGNGDRSNLILNAFEDWFDDEYPIYEYDKPPGYAGHYTQIVTAHSIKLGCGANACYGYTYARLVCDFYVGGNVYQVPPFKVGPACSKCPSGYGYCKSSLCASHRVCAGDYSCRCTVDQSKCYVNGEFDASTCECKCRPGWIGLNCDERCEDRVEKMCKSRAKQGECIPSATNRYFADMYLNCRGACGYCTPLCRDLDPNGDCKTWGDYGYCTESKYRVWVSSQCPKTCNLC